MAKNRKTREEKIIAELRRKLENTPKVQSTPKSEIVSPKSTYIISTAINNKPTAVSAYDYSYVKKDLLKTISLTSVAIFAFIVLYWRMN